MIANATTESIALVFLNKAGDTLGMHHLPQGRLSSVDIPVRIIVAIAMAHESQDVLIAHNHPSGDPEPSQQDLRTTQRVANALEALGIRLVDHLVLAADASVSFRARGLL